MRRYSSTSRWTRNSSTQELVRRGAAASSCGAGAGSSSLLSRAFYLRSDCADPLYVHPLTNEASTALSGAALLKFMESTGHAPQIIDFAAPL